jgi:hypothetical protein
MSKQKLLTQEEEQQIVDAICVAEKIPLERLGFI